MIMASVWGPRLGAYSSPPTLTSSDLLLSHPTQLLVRRSMLRSPRLPYNSVVYRQLLRKSRSLNRFQANRIASARFLSVAATTDLIHTASNHHVKRPYEFHIGCSYAGKPEDPTDKLRKVPFPEDTLIGGWRDKMLAWPKGVPFNTAGEDFFFVQEVRIASISREHRRVGARPLSVRA
jgi:hypothetical protein